MRFSAPLALLVLAAASSSHAAVHEDTLLNNTSQIRTMSNNPFFGANTVDVVGIDFHYLNLPTAGTVNGVDFDHINPIQGQIPAPTGSPYLLMSNQSNATLSLNLGFTSDNTRRTQNLAAGGADAATLNSVANEMFYVGGGNHASPSMTFGNLGANRNVYVQLIGGDQGWNGDLAVSANGGAVGTWTTVADSSANNGSLFAFDTTTNGAGSLTLDFGIAAGNFAGISGVVISADGGGPLPSTAGMSDQVLNHTAQIVTNVPGATPTPVAGANFHYNTGGALASGDSINGIGFDNVDLTGGSPPTGPFLLGANGTVTQLDLALAFTSDNTPRNQNVNATGTDAAVLNNLGSRMFYVGGANHANPSMTFRNLGANEEVFVQVIGGDSGWNGDLAVVANGNNVGTWTTVSDGSANNASLSGFYATTDGSGNLQLDFSIAAGNFSGIAGVAILGSEPLAQQGFDGNINDTSQIALNPFGEPSPTQIGINFHNTVARLGDTDNANGIVGADTLLGIGFTDVNIGTSGANVTDLPVGAGLTLTTDFELLLDREQNVSIAGPDGAVLERLLRDVHALGTDGGGGCCNENSLTLSGLDGDGEVFIQLFGGEENWSADVDVLVNGSSVGVWESVADSNLATGSSFGFFATADGSGDLLIEFEALAGPTFNTEFAGLSGLIVSTAPVVPEPHSIAIWLFVGLTAAAVCYLRLRRGKMSPA